MSLTQLSAAELAQELALAQAREAQVAKVAAEQAKEAAAQAREAERQAGAQLDRLEAELARVLTTLPGDRPEASMRPRARGFLYGPPDATAAEALEDLADRDEPTGRLHGVLMAAGRVMQQLDATSDAYARADDLETAAWSGLVGHIRVLAGER